MAKAELGTKRVCPTTGRKFYDLNKDPIISPYTGMVVPLAPVTAARARAEAKSSAADAPDSVDDEEDVELVSLEEADEDETTTGKKDVAGADDVDVEDDELPDSDDDDVFLEDEDEDVDATDLIDGDVSDDEES